MGAQEFINKYTGVAVPGNNAFIGQCVDLIQLYAQLVCGWQNPFLDNANGWWGNYDPNYFDRIPYTQGAVPQLGDIVIWDFGKYGHIAIATGSGNSGWFNSLDNNWPWGLDNNYHPTAVITHNYNNVLGWLRPKKGDEMSQDTVNDIYQKITEDRKELARISNDNVAQWDKMQDIKDSVKIINDSLAKMAQSELIQDNDVKKALSQSLEALSKPVAPQKDLVQLLVDWWNKITKKGE